MRDHDAAMLPAPKRCFVMCIVNDTSFWVNAYASARTCKSGLCALSKTPALQHYKSPQGMLVT